MTYLKSRDVSKKILIVCVFVGVLVGSFAGASYFSRSNLVPNPQVESPTPETENSPTPNEISTSTSTSVETEVSPSETPQATPSENTSVKPTISLSPSAVPSQTPIIIIIEPAPTPYLMESNHISGYTYKNTIPPTINFPESPSPSRPKATILLYANSTDSNHWAFTAIVSDGTPYLTVTLYTNAFKVGACQIGVAETNQLGATTFSVLMSNVGDFWKSYDIYAIATHS